MKLYKVKDDKNFKILSFKDVNIPKYENELFNCEVKIEPKGRSFNVVYYMIQDDIPIYEQDFNTIDSSLREKFKNEIENILQS